MSTRPNRYRFVVSIAALTLFGALTFAAIGGKFSSLLTAEASAESAPVTAVEPLTILTIGTCDTAGPVEVESTGGTTTPTAYATLKGAFDAINAGTHSGSINIEICGNTTETATASLDASGAGTTSYTDVTVRPVGGPRTIDGSLSGTSTGAIVKLNGADNVTIDGRQGGTGTARYLTINNDSSTAGAAAIWLSSLGVDLGATNNVIRNLELACGISNSNANTTVGIIMSGTTISVTSNGADNDNNQFLFNRITSARYGIVTRGVTTNNNITPIITDNIIGPNAFGADGISKTGILLQADTGGIVSRNTVQFIGGDLANTTAGTDRAGIGVGTDAWSATSSTTITSGDYTITKNIIHDVVEERTFSSAGIILGTTRSGSATNNLVANNFIYNIRSNGTSGDQLVGIGISGGNGDSVVFNSISLTGDMDPGAATATTTYGNAIRIPGANAANNANFTVANNSIYLDASSSSTATERYYAITLNSAAYSFGTGSLNRNNYYINPANTQLQTGGLGSNTGNSITTEFATLANWQAALTTPQDANSIQADPQHFSTTSDLHIQTSSPNVNAGTTISGITDDIDGQARPNGANFDIGADEFYPSPGSVQLSASTFTVSESAGMVTVTVTRSGGSNGAASVDYSTGGGTATSGGSCGGSVDYVSTSGTLMWADLDAAPKMINVPICADGVLEAVETFNVTLSNAMTATLGTPSVATVNITDAGSTFNGPVNVGTGETLTSLTNPGGIFDAINNGIVTGNITVNITSNLTGESGSVPLNEVAGGFTVLIKPNGMARSITSTGSAVAVIKLNDADNVTIDGSLGGGTDRSLSITNTNVAANTAVVWVASATNGAQNNTVKNVNISGGVDQNVTNVFNFAIIASSSASILTGGTDLDNNTYSNNSIQKVNVGILSIGGLAANMNESTVISNNLIGPSAFGSDQIGTLGVLLFNENAPQVTGNEVRFIGSNLTTGGAAGRDHVGISLCTGSASWSSTTAPTIVGNVTGANISRNRIHDIVDRATFSAVGIVENCSNAAPTSNTIANNMIYGIQANGTSPDQTVGIGISNGNGDRVAYNSIYLTGDLDPVGATSSTISAFGISVALAAPANLTLKNNVSVMDLNSNTGTLLHSAFNLQSATFNFGTGGADFNDYFPVAANPQARVATTAGSGGTFYSTLGAYQAAVTPQEANSRSVDPLFVSGTDLHIQMGSPVIGMATPIAGITTDFDGQTRDGMPDIGADEFIVLVPGTLVFSSATYSVGEAGTMATLTVNRTGGSDGAVSVDYSLGSGTATGGAACGGAVDYVNPGGTLMFANGDTSKTFDVPICNDAIYEGDETFDATLSNAMGGATIGMPGSATVTITDDETQPTVQFSSATYMTTEALAPEGGTGAVITVTLSGPSQGGASVDYATVAGGTATGGATCTPGVDYINTSGTLNFVAGDVSESFFVTTCPDTDDELDETVNLALSNPVGTTLGTPNTAVLTIIDNDTPSGGPVTVTATAGTPGPTDYPTLLDAVTAINAGTHQGAVTVSIVTSTTETATSVLNGSGAGPAAYTSVVIRPVSDGVTVAGPSVQGRGLIELNGADNVTIDGDNPNTGGTNRNLTIQNTAANTTTFTSVIRIATNITTVNSADNNIFRNLNIVGSSTGANVSTATTTTGPQNTTFGIFSGPNASGPDTAPNAITSVLTGVASGATASNLVVSNNSVVTAARAISINGSATTVHTGLQVRDNSIGNPVAGEVDQVTSFGITASGSTGAVIAGNTVYVEGFIDSSTATQGIGVGVNSTNTVTSTIEKNKVNRVKNNNPVTSSAFGINVAGTTGSAHIVQNNFVSGVINDQTAGTGGFGTTFGAYGIRIISGTDHKIYHNSVHLYGAMPGATSTNLTAALMIPSTLRTGLDVRNNIFSNQITGGNPDGTRHAVVYLPSGGTSTMNLTLNNNAYFEGGDPLSRLAQVGPTFATSIGYFAADFDPTQTTPATNFRAYSSTLSAAGTNDNASFALTTPPPFTSNVDLHIPAGTATRIESGGAAVGVVDDIDLDVRNATTPDIGADEFAGNPAPANDMAASGFVVPANGSTIPTGGLTPQARFTNAGTATQTNVTVRFRIFDSSMMEIYNQIATIPTIAPLQSIVVSFPMTTIANPGMYTMQASAELAGDQNTSNDTISGSFTAIEPLGGTISVGTGETYTSLTNPGGVFEALNTAGISGNLTVNITSDLAGETGAVRLNQLSESGAGGYTVTFKPSGAARTITGSSAVSNGLINLHGADRIVFDGSLSGGTDRSLTITNAQTGTSTVFWIRSASAANGANNNTIKNCIINGTSVGATAQTTAGILAGSGVTLGGPAEAPNNDNTITNNWIYRVQNSLYNQGNVGLDQNWSVTDNEFGSSVEADKNRFRGMLMGNANNFVISGNFVHGVTNFTGTTGANSGIQLAFVPTNGNVHSNRITDIHNLSASGTGAFGMQLSAAAGTLNNVIANNFISDVQAVGSATVASNGFGITINAAAPTGAYKLYHNSINMNTNQTSGTSAALNLTATVVAAGAVDVRNNIFANTQTAGATRRTVHSAAAASVFGMINFNDYFSTGSVGFIGGSDRPTLADWQTGTGQDANSKAVDPLFVSPTDLHIQPSSTMINMGVAGTGITTDIDGQMRDAMPDIGADEVPQVAMPGSLQFSSPTYSVGEAGGTATIGVTRTGGSSGTVTVDYATVAGGSATGGASCIAGIDYVNASGTLTFLDGETNKTFDVTICNDAMAEPDETVNLGLTNATGGATIGMPSTAVLTILDDDSAPTTFNVSINDVRIIEGNSGMSNAVFNVTLSTSGPPTVALGGIASVQYATANGTATAGSDYTSASGTINFNSPGTQMVSVPILGDVIKEQNEFFFVNLSNPSPNTTIVDGQGAGVIVDEDRPYTADFDRDLKADFSVFRPSTAIWYVLQSSNGANNIGSVGPSGMTPVPGDYDGDGKTDFAVWQASSGNWFVLRSSDSGIQTTAWGLSTDKPVQGDYDGDGNTDIAVFRPSNGTWYVIRSTNGTTYAVPFGISTDRPVQGDYDGDFKTDVAVYRDGTWYIARSSDGTVQTSRGGIASDKPIPADYDGDGRHDLAIYRDGVWWIFNSLSGVPTVVAFGTATDIPAPADYDGDGITDVGVFRPSSGDWYVLRSSDGSLFGPHWGVNGDVPVPSAYLPQ